MLAVIVVFSGATSVLAETAVGIGPESATAPFNDWMSIDAGEKHWYTFNYDGEEGSIGIEMEVSPQGSVGFSVWTTENLVRWANGLEVEEVGRGTASDDENLLNWCGCFPIAGTYYVVVEHSGITQTGYYKLSIRGDGVYFPEAVVEEVEMPEVAAFDVLDEEAETEVTHEAEGMIVLGEWAAVTAGDTDWLHFQYGGGDETLTIWAEAVPTNGVAFSVWTPNQMLQVANGENVDPIGWGATSEFGPGDLSWTGSFNEAGTYCVIVEQTSLVSGASYYALHIN
jgi:hypothetical protein